MSQRFYITTPIYYLNAAPHLGTAYSTIAADALARYHRLRGHDTHFLTGTDEHGQKIVEAATAQGLEPQAYVDRMSAKFRDAWPQLNIVPDDFIRTTEPRHIARVQELWNRIAQTGDIYLGEYEGWYCVADEAFYTEKELVNGLSPTGRPVEKIRESSYFFRLSKYTDRLLDFYERNPGFIEPETRLNEVRSFVKGGLQDLSVSRTSFTWGIPVPGDPKHVMYVWFDALANYWSALGDETNPLRRFWPADVHLVGKEISRFHAVYWPAFLMAAGLTDDQLPRKVYAHGWLTVNGAKMSKATGNVLDPLPIAKEVGPDALRYYLLRAVAFGQDGDFSHQDLLTRINTELGNDFGNLLNRTLGLLAKNTGGLTPTTGPSTELETALHGAAHVAATRAAHELDELAPHRALDAIWAFCREANIYVDRSAPWKELKAGNKERVETILGNLLEACRVLSVLVSPFLPSKAVAMRDQLGLPQLVAAIDKDQWPFTWNSRPAGEPLSLGEPLFPRLDEDRQKAILELLVPRPPVVEAPAAAAQAPGAAAPAAEAGAKAADALLPPVTYDQFATTDLRVGLVVSAERVPRKDKLLDLRVDVGEATPRRIVAGLALSFKPEDLVGRRVIVVANLAPRDFGKGLISHGMLLATGPSESLSLLGVDDRAAPGSKVK